MALAVVPSHGVVVASETENLWCGTYQLPVDSAGADFVVFHTARAVLAGTAASRRSVELAATLASGVAVGGRCLRCRGQVSHAGPRSGTLEGMGNG